MTDAATAGGDNDNNKKITEAIMKIGTITIIAKITIIIVKTLQF